MTAKIGADFCRRLLGVLLCLAGVAAPFPCLADRDVLSRILKECIPARSPENKWPQTFQCPVDTLCGGTVEVWAEERDKYLAIRSAEMCGCSHRPDFFHGLAMPPGSGPGAQGGDGGPRGLEDLDKVPKDIWRFAWQVAALRKPKEQDASVIALVVNEENNRSQDHFHMHLVRLRNAAELTLAESDPRVRSSSVRTLDAVPSKVMELKLRSPEFRYFGVLVGKVKGHEDFVVLVRENPDGSHPNTESRYAIKRCPSPP